MNSPVVEFFNTPFAITSIICWLVVGIILLFLIGIYMLVGIAEGYKDAKEDQLRYKIRVDCTVYDNVQYSFEKSSNVVHIVFFNGRRPLSLVYREFEELEVYDNEKK